MITFNLPIDEQILKFFQAYCRSIKQTPEEYLTKIISSGASIGAFYSEMEDLRNQIDNTDDMVFGCLDLYTDMGMEGYHEVAFFEGATNNLNDMNFLFPGDYVKVYDRSKSLVWDAVIKNQDELRTFAEQRFLAYVRYTARSNHV